MLKLFVFIVLVVLSTALNTCEDQNTELACLAFAQNCAWCSSDVQCLTWNACKVRFCNGSAQTHHRTLDCGPDVIKITLYALAGCALLILVYFCVVGCTILGIWKCKKQPIDYERLA